ncbi:hypothetical protein SAMN04490220_0328 [Rhodococcus jostii]|uniref:Uncharacterized protein n=1 Tax=Rhodococcus jostii TaxID=132919 RepID=A0A1H4IPB2_RHOJO|nr:hypothetical protein SAMN04490220_0328 [Rhodococcus jostii]
MANSRSTSAAVRSLTVSSCAEWTVIRTCRPTAGRRLAVWRARPILPSGATPSPLVNGRFSRSGRRRCEALPSLATVDISADPHLITVAARTGTDIELQIHTSIAPFDVAAEQWFPAVAGFAVTVLAHTLDAETGRPRYLPPAEPAERARAIFSTAGATYGYFLGAVDPDTGDHRRGAARIPPLPRHRPSGDSRATTGAHLPALSTLRHRRQGPDHHSHDRLTITRAAAQPNPPLTCHDDTSPNTPARATNHGRRLRR